MTRRIISFTEGTRGYLATLECGHERFLDERPKSPMMAFCDRCESPRERLERAKVDARAARTSGGPITRAQWFVEYSGWLLKTAEKVLDDPLSDGLRSPCLKLRKEIESAINRCSAENISNTPDFLLAEFLIGCLSAFDSVTTKREAWHGRITAPAPESLRGSPNEVASDRAHEESVLRADAAQDAASRLPSIKPQTGSSPEQGEAIQELREAAEDVVKRLRAKEPHELDYGRLVRALAVERLVSARPERDSCETTTGRGTESDEDGPPDHTLKEYEADKKLGRYDHSIGKQERK